MRTATWYVEPPHLDQSNLANYSCFGSLSAQDTAVPTEGDHGIEAWKQEMDHAGIDWRFNNHARTLACMVLLYWRFQKSVLIDWLRMQSLYLLRAISIGTPHGFALAPGVFR